MKRSILQIGAFTKRLQRGQIAPYDLKHFANAPLIRLVNILSNYGSGAAAASYRLIIYSATQQVLEEAL